MATELQYNTPIQFTQAADGPGEGFEKIKKGYAVGNKGYVRGSSMKDGKLVYEVLKINEAGIDIIPNIIKDVPADHVKEVRADLMEEVEKRLKEQQKTKEFKDIGDRVRGSRKEKVAIDRIQWADLEEIEKDSVLAEKLIVKKKVYPEIDFSVEKDNGATAGAVYIKHKLRAAMATKPEKSERFRRIYVRFIDRLVEMLDQALTVEDVRGVRETIENWTLKDAIILVEPNLESMPAEKINEHWKEKYGRDPEETSWSYFNRKLIQEMFGKRFSNVMFGRSDAGKMVWVDGKRYERWTEQDQQKAITAAMERMAKRVAKSEESLKDLKAISAKEGAEKYYHFYHDQPYRTNPEVAKEGAIARAEKFLSSQIESLKGDPIDLLPRQDRVLRGDDWSWAEKKRATSKRGERKHDLVINAGTPLSFIKRTGGLPIMEDMVTADNVVKMFGFKSVQFGAAMTDKLSREHIRHFLGAMSDLAEVLNYDISDVNDIGGLSMAFGARGHGRAMAHYESGRVIINITASRGNGAVAHEWAHYLDNALLIYSREEKITDFASGKVLGRTPLQVDDDAIREKLHKLMTFIINGDPNYNNTIPVTFEQLDKGPKYRTGILKPTIEETIQDLQKKYPSYGKIHPKNIKENEKIYSWILKQFDQESITLDMQLTGISAFHYYAKKLGKYWSKPIEMFARAFETFAYDKLAAADRVNNYLVSGDSFDHFMNPYPFGSERERLFELYDDLMKTIKHSLDIGDFTPWSGQRVDEFINIEPVKGSATPDEQGIIVDEKTDEIIEVVDADPRDSDEGLQLRERLATAQAQELELLELEISVSQEPTGIEIRDAEQEEYKAFSKRLTDMDLSWDQKDLAGAFATGRSRTGKEKWRGAFMDGKMVGAIIYKDDDELDANYLSILIVDPEYRRKGVAKAMVEYAMDDSDYPHTYTHPHTELSDAFFAGLGFEVDKSFDPKDENVMIKGVGWVDESEEVEAAEETEERPDYTGTQRTLLSLFDYTGEWARPFAMAGWNVIQWDIKIQPEMDINNIVDAEYALENFENVDGILAAIPCTDFACSGARWFKGKDEIGQTEMSVELVNQVMRLVDLFTPTDPDFEGTWFWAIENPVGRIGTLVPEIGSAYYFQPSDYAGWLRPSAEDLKELDRIRAKDGKGVTAEEAEFIIKMNAYTKKTGLWGDFIVPGKLPIEPVKGSPTGSVMQRFGGGSAKNQEIRSATPEGFAKAFYAANNNKVWNIDVERWQDDPENANVVDPGEPDPEPIEQPDPETPKEVQEPVVEGPDREYFDPTARYHPNIDMLNFDQVARKHGVLKLVQPSKAYQYQDTRVGKFEGQIPNDVFYSKKLDTLVMPLHTARHTMFAKIDPNFVRWLNNEDTRKVAVKLGGRIYDGGFQSAKPQKKDPTAAEFGIQYSIDDIGKEYAERAFSGVSFSPEKRGERTRKDYVDFIEQTFNELYPLAKKYGKLDSFKGEFQRFVDGYKKRKLDYLSTQSRSMSTMITGPANFPVARQEKVMRSLGNKLDELVDYGKRIPERIRYNMMPAESKPVKTGQKDAVKILETKLNERVALQEQMKAANKIIRKAIKDKETVKQTSDKLREIGLSDKAISQILNPSYGPKGYQTFHLSNNSAEIRRLKGRIVQEKRIEAAREKVGDQEREGKTCDASVNQDRNGIELRFDDKPSDEIRTEIKRNGFRWSGRQKLWYARFTDARWQFALKICGIEE